MGPRLDVVPERFRDAAQVVIGDVVPPADGAALRLCAVLDGCAEMAGADPPGRSWAQAYDAAAVRAVRATRLLVDTSYRLGVLLERTGLNHAHADAASTAGPRIGLPVMRHEPDWHTVLGDPPSAAGGHPDAPTGWGLIEDLVGHVWPSGHQDRLHQAADAWTAAADGLDEAADALPLATISIAVVTSPEVDDAITALQGLRRHYLDLARADRALARTCRDLAHQIDTAHSSAEHALVELVAFVGGAEVIGFGLSLLTFGAAELPTQAAVAARAASTAGTVRTILQTLQTAVETISATIPSVGQLADGVATALQPLARLRPIIAGAQDVRVLGGEMRMAKAAGGAGRELAAQQRLAAAATRTVAKAESKIWKNLKPYRGKYRTNGAQGRRRRFYEWDHTHDDIEVYDRLGAHLGSMDAITGKMTKPPKPGRTMK